MFFHIENNNKSFSCCIRLDVPEYFIHGKHKDKLSNNDIKNLIKDLNNQVDDDFDMTEYEFACLTWNKGMNDNKYKIKKPFKMPDYTKLND